MSYPSTSPLPHLLSTLSPLLHPSPSTPPPYPPSLSSSLLTLISPPYSKLNPAPRYEWQAWINQLLAECDRLVQEGEENLMRRMAVENGGEGEAGLTEEEEAELLFWNGCVLRTEQGRKALLLLRDGFTRSLSHHPSWYSLNHSYIQHLLPFVLGTTKSKSKSRNGDRNGNVNEKNKLDLTIPKRNPGMKGNRKRIGIDGKSYKVPTGPGSTTTGGEGLDEMTDYLCRAEGWRIGLPSEEDEEPSSPTEDSDEFPPLSPSELDVPQPPFQNHPIHPLITTPLYIKLLIPALENFVTRFSGSGLIRPWLWYAFLFLHPACPEVVMGCRYEGVGTGGEVGTKIGKGGSPARQTFDRALQSLPQGNVIQERIWRLYLRWSGRRGGLELKNVWGRWMQLDPSPTPLYISLLLSPSNPSPRPLEAAKLALKLAVNARDGKFKSPEGKSPYQLLRDFLAIAERFPEIGMDEDEEAAWLASLPEAERSQFSPNIQPSPVKLGKEKLERDGNMEGIMDLVGLGNGKGKMKEGEQQPPQPAPATLHGPGPLMRMAGPAVPTVSVLRQQASSGNKTTGPAPVPPAVAQSPLPEYLDTESESLLPITPLIRLHGLSVYLDQAGPLYVSLGLYWIKKGQWEKARSTFWEGIENVVTVRDFQTVFDEMCQFEEEWIKTLMEEEEEEEEEEGDKEEGGEKELDQRMREFEELMDRRPFLVNEVLLRRNPNDVQEWEKRIVLWGEDDEKVAETYTVALSTINPKKATANFHNLFINFARFYEEGGAVVDPEHRAEGDLNSARRVLSKAVEVPFKRVDELAEIWCEWAEMEVRHHNYDEAIRVMERAATVPRKNNVNYHDESLPVQARLFKSLKLWSFYIDLEESLGTVESTKRVYDKTFELKIANPQIIVNYANFLEERDYFEESFKVYERGVDLFTFPVVFEIWNAYLSKFVKRYGGDKIERTRDLFEQALERCPPKYAKPIFLMYGQLEEDHGLAKRAMSIYDRATSNVELEDRFEMFTYYVAKAASNFGLAATRPIYQKAIEALPDRQTAEMCLRFAVLERKLGEIDRARRIYGHGSQFCDPRTEWGREYWKEWNNFEIEHGSEDTFREMLRIKRSVQASFNTEASYIAARVSNAMKGQKQAPKAPGAVVAAAQATDPMAALESAKKAANTMFVPAKNQPGKENGTANGKASAEVANADEIEIDEDDV